MKTKDYFIYLINTNLYLNLMPHKNKFKIYYTNIKNTAAKQLKKM